MNAPMNAPILVPLDGSGLAEQALPFAEALAILSGSPLVLLYASYVAEVFGIDSSETQVQELAAAEAYLRKIAVHLKRRGLAVETCAPYGLAGRAIAREASARHAWLIVMATHGRGTFGRFFSGSVAADVIRRATVPLLLLRAWHAGDARARLADGQTIVVPLDGSELAETALPVAQALAASLNSPLLLVRAVPPPDPVLTPDGMAVALFTEDRAAAEREAGEYLTTLVTRLAESGTTVQTLVRLGKPAEIIRTVAEEHGAALTVLATHGRTGVDRLLLGSVAEAVVHHGATPVLLVPASSTGAVLPMLDTEHVEVVEGTP